MLFSVGEGSSGDLRLVSGARPSTVVSRPLLAVRERQLGVERCGCRLTSSRQCSMIRLAVKHHFLCARCEGLRGLRASESCNVVYLAMRQSASGCCRPRGSITSLNSWVLQSPGMCFGVEGTFWGTSSLVFGAHACVGPPPPPNIPPQPIVRG